MTWLRTVALFFFSIPLLVNSLEQAVVESFLVLHDHKKIVATIEKENVAYDQNPTLLLAYLKSLIALGRDGDAIQLAKEFGLESTEEKLRILEELAWVEVDQGLFRTSPIVRAECALAAAASGDPRAVQIVQQCLNDENPIVRIIAILAGIRLRNDKIIFKIVEMAGQDRSCKVRLAALQALADLGDERCLDRLIQLFRREIYTYEERQQLALAISSSTKSNRDSHIMACLSSKEPNMILLGCALSQQAEKEEAIAYLRQHIHSSWVSVRVAALQALGLSLKLCSWSQEIEPLPNEGNFAIRLSSYWLYSLIENRIERMGRTGLGYLEDEFYASPAGYRPYVVAALGQIGGRGDAALLKLWGERDRFDLATRINIAMALQDHNLADDGVLECYIYALDSANRFNQGSLGIFKPITIQKSSLAKADSAAVEENDFRIRLDIVERISLFDKEVALQKAVALLRSKAFGISGNTFLMMLAKAHPTSCDYVSQQLREGGSVSVRLQAALALAIWGRSPTAIDTLLELWPKSNREEREKVIAAIGYIGDRKAIPFLLDVMGSGTPSQRISASAALLQVLYR